MTFNSHNRRGLQNKTVTVISNDPSNGTSKLLIAAFVEVEFGFKTTSVRLGRVPEGQSVEKEVELLIKDMKKTKLTKLTTSTPFLAAKEIKSDSNGVTIKLTLSPGLPPGAFLENVIAHSNNDSFPEAKLTVSGSILGDVSVAPEALMLYVAEPGKTNPNTSRKVTITNHKPNKPLKKVTARDPDGRLDLVVNTIENGMRFEVTATVKDKFLSADSTMDGTFIVMTDNPKAKELPVKYKIIVQNKK